MNRNLVVLLTFLAGGVLMYSGIKNVSPIDLIKNTLQGKVTKPAGDDEFEDAQWGENPTKPGNRNPDVDPNPPRQGKPLPPTGGRGPVSRFGNGAV